MRLFNGIVAFVTKRQVPCFHGRIDISIGIGNPGKGIRIVQVDCRTGTNGNGFRLHKAAGYIGQHRVIRSSNFDLAFTLAISIFLSFYDGFIIYEGKSVAVTGHHIDHTAQAIFSSCSCGEDNACPVQGIGGINGRISTADDNSFSDDSDTVATKLLKSHAGTAAIAISFARQEE